jgi:hypothetical protein
MHQQLCGYKVEEKLDVGFREQKSLNITGLIYDRVAACHVHGNDAV